MADSRLNAIQRVWAARIRREEAAHREFRKRGREIQRMIDLAEEDCDPRYVPLYWSVTSVEATGVYSAQPTPDVRCKQRGTAYEAVAKLLKAGLDYVADARSFDTNMTRAVLDYLRTGLGWPRVRVESIVDDQLTTVPIIDEMGREVGFREETVSEIGDQTVRWEYVPWSRFGWEPTIHWDTCNWIYIRHTLTQTECKKRFGKTVAGKKLSQNEEMPKTVDVFEIWDKENRKVVFFAKGEQEPLEVLDDPLGLVDFWPGPQPMMTNVMSDKLIPVPDYNFIEEYDREINDLQDRRRNLIDQIKSAGMYDKGIKELGKLLELGDGEMMGVDNLAQRIAAAGGSEGMFYLLEIDKKVEVLRQVTEQRALVKAEVDEILGISDIVRGVTRASETAAAQEIKGRWVGLRLTPKRTMVQYTIREMFRISAQLLTSVITPQNLSRMTQLPITGEMQQILDDQVLTLFSIDVETDSTIAKDEFRERETRQEMLNGMAQFAQNVLPMVQQNAFPASVSSAMLHAAMAPYAKYDRQLQEALMDLPDTQQQLQTLNQQLQQSQQQYQQLYQQWQVDSAELQRLRQAAAEAKARRESADAAKKQAETDKIRAASGNRGNLERADKVAEIDLKRAQAMAQRNGGRNDG